MELCLKQYKYSNNSLNSVLKEYIKFNSNQTGELFLNLTKVKRNWQVDRISSVIEGSILSCLGFLPLMTQVDFVWWTLFSPSANLRFGLFTLQSQQRITLTAKGRKSDQELVEVRGALWFSYVFALNRNECNWVAQGWLGVFKKKLLLHWSF